MPNSLLTFEVTEWRSWLTIQSNILNGEMVPLLVLVPGLAGGIGLLGPLVRELAKKFRVISYQLRGEDNCFALRRPFSMMDLVEDLHEFINWHFLESPTILGVSFGGVLALEFARALPAPIAEPHCSGSWCSL